MSKKNNKTPGEGGTLPPLFKYTVLACTTAFILLLAGGVLIYLKPDLIRPTPVQEPFLRPFAESLIMQETAAKMLAVHIRKHYDKPAILIVAPPAELELDAEKVSMDTLLRELSDTAGDIRVVEPDIDHEALPYAGLWFRADAFDKAVADCTDIDIVITTVGLPTYPDAMTFWHKRPRPHLMILNGEILRLPDLIENNGIQAVVTRYPLQFAENNMPPPDSPAYWMLLTPENIGEIRRLHPQTFAASPNAGDKTGKQHLPNGKNP